VIKDNPESREELEALARDKAYRKIREKLKTELDQRVSDLKRADTGSFLSLQGRISALEFVLGLPQQLYRDAGGKRALFEGGTE
jgi:hypothetical protein